MNMKAIFDDFKTYVDAMDDATLLANIQKAVEDTADSVSLDLESDNIKMDSLKSSEQEINGICMYTDSYAFSSVKTDYSTIFYVLSPKGGIAA